MIDPQTQARLCEIVRRESRSLLTYAAEAYPWTTMRGGEVLGLLQQLIAEEQVAVTALGRFLVRCRIDLPYLGAFPSKFTTVNFISLNYLLPLLIESERLTLAALEADLEVIQDPKAQRLVEQLAAVKRRHLPALEAFAVPGIETATGI